MDPLDCAWNRAEILALHVPDENEEWMQYELSKLSQFTRIFPAGDPRMKNKGGSNEDIDREEDNDNGEVASYEWHWQVRIDQEEFHYIDDNEDGEEEKDKSKDKDKDKTFAKSCPYDEILYQVRALSFAPLFHFNSFYVCGTLSSGVHAGSTTDHATALPFAESSHREG
jgi:hypothetical protein